MTSVKLAQGIAKRLERYSWSFDPLKRYGADLGVSVPTRRIQTALQLSHMLLFPRGRTTYGTLMALKEPLISQEDFSVVFSLFEQNTARALLQYHLRDKKGLLEKLNPDLIKYKFANPFTIKIDTSEGLVADPMIVNDSEINDLGVSVDAFVRQIGRYFDYLGTPPHTEYANALRDGLPLMFKNLDNWLPGLNSFIRSLDGD